MFMSVKKCLIFLFLVPIVLFILTVAVISTYVFLKPPDPKCVKFKSNFNSITNQMIEVDIIRLLGEDFQKNTNFFIGQYDLFEEIYSNAAKVKTDYYYIWYGMDDITYTIGFKNKRVVFKASGGT